jgi:hypothetical protein
MSTLLRPFVVVLLCCSRASQHVNNLHVCTTFGKDRVLPHQVHDDQHTAEELAALNSHRNDW